MPTLKKDPRTQCWSIRFYWNGKQCQRTCGTKRKAVANRTLARVEETLEDLKRHKAVIPKGLSHPLQVDWILSGGILDSDNLASGYPSRKRERATDTQRFYQFGNICKSYLEDQAQKQETTISGEMIHISHLKRILGANTILQQIDLESLKRYRRRRNQQQHHERHITDATVKKELVTFRQIWCWAKDHDYVTESCPLVGENRRWRIQFEKQAEKEKFRTWEEIERRINRGGLSAEEIAELWEGLYLDQSQVADLLDHVKENARHDFIYPMFAFTAYTGARRSEIIRSRIDDIQFDSNQILIREKKRRKDKSETTRLVPLHPKLRITLEAWFKVHPGGSFTIQCPKVMPFTKPLTQFKGLTPGQADWHFDKPLDRSRWSVIRGFHVLRHSFGSNLTRSGKVPSDVVAKWMGHTTMEMRELYQHLFPQDGLEHISVLD